MKLCVEQSKPASDSIKHLKQQREPNTHSTKTEKNDTRDALMNGGESKHGRSI